MNHRFLFYLILSIKCTAYAHDVEVSRSELIADGNVVHVHVEVAKRLLRDGGTLGELVRTSMEVSLGNLACDPAIDRETAVGEDGTAVDATYTCPAPSSDLAASMHWLTSLPEGHRHVAHLVVGKTALTAMLTAEHPSASMSGVREVTPVAQTSRWPWILGVLAIAALAVTLYLRRSRIRSDG